MVLVRPCQYIHCLEKIPFLFFSLMKTTVLIKESCAKYNQIATFWPDFAGKVLREWPELSVSYSRQCTRVVTVQCRNTVWCGRSIHKYSVFIFQISIRSSNMADNQDTSHIAAYASSLRFNPKKRTETPADATLILVSNDLVQVPFWSRFILFLQWIWLLQGWIHCRKIVTVL